MAISNTTVSQQSLLGKASMKKKNVFFRALPELPKPPPPWPEFGQLGPLFSGRQNSRFKSHLGGGEGDILKPKKQLKVQYIGIFEEIDSFYWPKMHF